MDDQTTYLLNGLLGRNFGLGRIVRFRKVARGRQADTYEIFTAQEREFLVHLFPPQSPAERLDFAAAAVNTLDTHRFSVVPFIPSKGGNFAAEGPQNSHMLVSLMPAGSYLEPGLYTDHDISEVGLRLAWMHRLLKDEGPALPNLAPLATRLRELCRSAFAKPLPVARDLIDPLLTILALPATQGWVHGDIQPPALLHDGDHQLRTVTDWGLLHVGSPLEDIVDALLSFCTDSEGRLQAARGHTLLESYSTLIPLAGVPWTPVVGSWCAQRILDATANRRVLPMGFEKLLKQPEHLAIALASCL